MLLWGCQYWWRGVVLGMTRPAVRVSLCWCCCREVGPELQQEQPRAERTDRMGPAGLSFLSFLSCFFSSLSLCSSMHLLFSPNLSSSHLSSPFSTPPRILPIPLLSSSTALSILVYLTECLLFIWAVSCVQFSLVKQIRELLITLIKVSWFLLKSWGQMLTIVCQSLWIFLILGYFRAASCHGFVIIFTSLNVLLQYHLPKDHLWLFVMGV